MKLGIEDAQGERTQRIYARLAGFLLLWLIINGLGSTLLFSQIAGSGTFAETAKRIAASERLYRVALCSQVIETLCAVLLAFALYATLKMLFAVKTQARSDPAPATVLDRGFG